MNGSVLKGNRFCEQNFAMKLTMIETKSLLH